MWICTAGSCQTSRCRCCFRPAIWFAFSSEFSRPCRRLAHRRRPSPFTALTAGLAIVAPIPRLPAYSNTTAAVPGGFR
ncbi:hypothetical protein EUGRSUZ_C01955 [Eucalyptus grandis]|uniref:Uncharacterized protein n=2 Tax=Eucalyptus grandis TaxID=71139 RepID=A0ACC3LEF0_EUCGR|nr:hypothetical protein EUGRSUZ_C01955 [Eucalyptus grandis]